jgi:RND family efflux transporter MFP subunit
MRHSRSIRSSSALISFAFAIAFLLSLSLSLTFVGCSKSEDDSSGGKGGKGGRGGRKLEYPVQVAPLSMRMVRYTVSAPGSIEAFQQVQITARVAGAVDKVEFSEGEQVKAGTVLVNIESERFQVAVDQAKAQLDKAQASEKQAEESLKRRQGASGEHPGLIPGEELATYQTQVATAKADVEVAQQALRVAQLNLRDSAVKAPIDGVVQTRTVQAGQYLQPGAVLATLLQRDPLILRFSVSEQDAPRLKAGMTANLTLKESARSYTATITLVAGAADPATRLVPVTAKLDATEHQYWLRPGAFCEVSVPVGATREAIVVPSLSIQPTESGNLAYIVDNNIARAKTVQLGMHTSNGEVEVTRGLAAGSMLVVRGVEPLSDGAPVKVTEQTSIEALEDGGSSDVNTSSPGGAAPPSNSPAQASADEPPEKSPSETPGSTETKPETTEHAEHAEHEGHEGHEGHHAHADGGQP